MTLMTPNPHIKCDCMQPTCHYCGRGMLPFELNILPQEVKKEEMKEEKPIRREPIILDKNTVALIHIFDRYDDIEDIFYLDSEKYLKEMSEQYEKSAKQFISQLDGEWCVLFFEKLIKEAFETMVKEDRAAFSKESAERLINKLKEINDGAN